MRFVSTLDDRQQANRLGAYLVSRGLDVHLQAGDGSGLELWVVDEDDLELVRAELSAFLTEPDAERYQLAVEAPAPTVPPQAPRFQHVDVRARWRRRGRGEAPVTALLIAASVVVALATKLGSGGDAWIARLLMSPKVLPGGGLASLDEIMHGQIWRLVTPIFLHFGILHILFNMWWLWDLGRLIEGRRGSFFFASQVLLLAVGSNLAEFFWSGPFFGGMSGVVYGLFGYIWLKSRTDPSAGYYVPESTVLVMLAWLGLGFVGLLGSMANGAHLGGLVLGSAMGASHLLRKRR